MVPLTKRQVVRGIRDSGTNIILRPYLRECGT
jgi:hypothetical protein